MLSTRFPSMPIASRICVVTACHHTGPNNGWMICVALRTASGVSGVKDVMWLVTRTARLKRDAMPVMLRITEVSFTDRSIMSVN